MGAKAESGTGILGRGPGVEFLQLGAPHEEWVAVGIDQAVAFHMKRAGGAGGYLLLPGPGSGGGRVKAKDMTDQDQCGDRSAGHGASITGAGQGQLLKNASKRAEIDAP